MSDDKNKKGPRGTKAEVDAVKRSAEAAGKMLDREQEKSLVHLAQALGEINEGEALAHLDTRLTFTERQVDRLSNRRDEMDRSVQGELTVMRTRIEEALSAVGATAEETKDAWVSLEKRLTGLIAQVERRSTTMVETIRREVVAKVESASNRLEKYEARLRGEMKAFEDESEERARSLGESISESRRELEGELETKVTDLDNWVREATEDFTRRLSEATENFEVRLTQGTGSLDEMQKRTSSLEMRLANALAEFEQRSIFAAGQFEEMLEEAKSNFDKQLADANNNIDRRIEGSIAALNEKIARLNSNVEQKIEANSQATDSRLEEAANAMEARLTATSEQIAKRLREASESLRTKVDESIIDAESRLTGIVNDRLESLSSDHQEALEGNRLQLQTRLDELQEQYNAETRRLNALLESNLGSSTDALETQKKEMLQRIRASEEKAAGAAIHLESMIIQQRRQMASDESEWSGQIEEIGAQLSELRNRTEELVGRVSTVDARWATERGSSQVALEGIGGRLDILEERVREAVEEVAAKHGTRLEMLASQVSALSEAEMTAEERFGSVEYLKRRVAEMAERVDEIVVKVNAIGRFVTKPLNTPVPGAPVVPAEIMNRLSVIEQSVKEVGSKPASDDTSARIAQLEKQIAALPAPTNGAEKQAVNGISSRIDSLEKVIQSLGSTEQTQTTELSGRLETLERAISELSDAAKTNEVLAERLEKLESAPTAAEQPAPPVEPVEQQIPQAKPADQPLPQGKGIWK